MVKVTFKNVGQGDSILFHWKESGIDHFGILDCNLYGDKNPILEEVILLGINKLDFLILSHLHADHFSGFPSLFEHIQSNHIEVDIFYHTFETQYFKILSEILDSQGQLRLAQRFLSLLNQLRIDKLIKDVVPINNRMVPIMMGSRAMYFLSPFGGDYMHFIDHQTRYLKGRTSVLPDFNSLSCICKIVDEMNQAILLTADSTKKPLRRLVGKIDEQVVMAQVPHHGSSNNHYPKLWNSLSKKQDCPVVFSVGDVKRDKLPNRPVVEFYDANGYSVEATNFVYGISEHFGPTFKLVPKTSKVSSSLSMFSSIVRSSHSKTPSINSRFTGDRVHFI